MLLTHNNYSISELREMLSRKDLIVNREYQRGARLWPAGPRSYFIDTILTSFPFPKLYFYEYLDRQNHKTKREIVDGQQRITAIMDFIEDKFAVTNVSKEYKGLRFSDLDDEAQTMFMSYVVPVDVIRNAEKSDVLEMFRRMNAYTLPLNKAEQRHSSYQGKFKWFINDLAREFTPIFIEFGILTKRQIVRMADAELLADMILATERGLVSSSDQMLGNLYKTYDDEFSEETAYKDKLTEFFDFLVGSLGELQGSFLMKPYVIHSLFSACIHNKYGLKDASTNLGIEPIGSYRRDLEDAQRGLQALAAAHEEKDDTGEFGKYVWGCSGGTNREPRRLERVKFLALALRGELLKG